ncbi:MAG: aldo/keto reductase [Armatimonadota bacterium]
MKSQTLPQHPFGERSGFAIPFANIGAMRLPQDLDAAVALVRHAIDSGMRYIDTCRRYGDSELKLGEALKDGYREKVILSSKWAPWVMRDEPVRDSSADFVRRKLDESLERLQLDRLDFYQLWSVQSRECWEQATAKGGMLEGLLKAKEEGLIGHLGFTTHDSVENVLSYIEEADWCEIILFTYNLRSRSYAPAIEAARRKGIGTVIMNPVGGGTLAEPNAHLERLAREVGAGSAPELALRWLISHGSTDGYICGIARPSDVDTAVAAAARGAFTPEQMAHIDATMAALDRGAEAFCTGCRYCLPCPEGIDIPAVMSIIAKQRYYDNPAAARAGYEALSILPAACVECGSCEERCTQHLKIMAEMASVGTIFG